MYNLFMLWENFLVAWIHTSPKENSLQINIKAFRREKENYRHNMTLQTPNTNKAHLSKNILIFGL